MSLRSHAAKTESVLDAGHGRIDALEELRGRLSSAPASYLEGALDNPALTHRELLLLLRNRNAVPALLSRIARDRSWTRFYEVKKAIVAHPKCPLIASRTLVQHLFWKDLVEVAVNVKAHPVIRRRSEELLRARVDELAVGERVALATRATRGLIPCLLESAESRVLSRLLSNPRLVEGDVVRIASGQRAPAPVLAQIAAHHRWGGRRDVRLAVLRNGRTPLQAALGLVAKLDQRDLQRLSKDGKVRRIVRIRAERQLENSAGGGTCRTRPGLGSSRLV
jgi:hypothetical protein